MLTTIHVTAALALALFACAPDDNDAEPGPDAGQEPDGTLDSGLTGDWSGSASSRAGRFIREGTFPARASFAQAGDVVVGLIDVEQRTAGNADHLGYRAKGSVDSTGAVTLELTDRICGAGEPLGLCYPDPGAPGAAVFRVRGRITNETLTLDSIETLRATHPSGDAVEAPFESLTITREAGGQIAGTRTGHARVPRSELFPLPLPLTGTGTMTIEGDAPTLSRLEWEGITYVPVPDGEDPIVLAESFRYDPATGRYWFLQVNSVYGRFVYVGQKIGGELRGAIYTEDPYNPTIYNPDAAPILFTDPPLASLLGTFNFQDEAAGSTP